MVTLVKNINGTPEYLPENQKATHITEEFFYFFESEEEHASFLLSLSQLDPGNDPVIV